MSAALVHITRAMMSFKDEAEDEEGTHSVYFRQLYPMYYNGKDHLTTAQRPVGLRDHNSLLVNVKDETFQAHLKAALGFEDDDFEELLEALEKEYEAEIEDEKKQVKDERLYKACSTFVRGLITDKDDLSSFLGLYSDADSLKDNRKCTMKLSILRYIIDGIVVDGKTNSPHRGEDDHFSFEDIVEGLTTANVVLRAPRPELAEGEKRTYKKEDSPTLYVRILKWFVTLVYLNEHVTDEVMAAIKAAMNVTKDSPPAAKKAAHVNSWAHFYLVRIFNLYGLRSLGEDPEEPQGNPLGAPQKVLKRMNAARTTELEKKKAELEKKKAEAGKQPKKGKKSGTGRGPRRGGPRKPVEQKTDADGKPVSSGRARQGGPRRRGGRKADGPKDGDAKPAGEKKRVQRRRAPNGSKTETKTAE